MLATSTLKDSCKCTALDMLVYFYEDLKCWDAWDTTCRHKAITPSIAWRTKAWKEEVLEDLPWKDQRGPLSIGWTLTPFQRRCWGNFWETGWSTHGSFHAHRYHLELNGSVKSCWSILIKEIIILEYFLSSLSLDKVVFIEKLIIIIIITFA